MPDNLAHIIETLPQALHLREVGAEAASLGIEAYAVGGLVRDLLLGHATADIDFVTVGPGTGVRLAKAVGKRLGGRIAHVYDRFGTAAIRLPESDTVLEFVAARRESYRKESRKPLVEEGTLQEDLLRRDFTINALAVNVAPDRFGDVIDPFRGRLHLEQRRLSTPRPPQQTFADDPLRMIRAARFAAQLCFTIEPEARRAMRREAHRIRILSQERITEELGRIMASPHPSTGILILEEADILGRILPELSALKGVDTIGGQRHKDNFYHTLQVVDNLVAATRRRSDDSAYWLRWAALLHDIGKPIVKRLDSAAGWTFHGHEDRGARMIPRLFRRLKLPLDERMEYVRMLVALHHRPVALVDDLVTDSAVRRLLFDAGDALDDLMTLVRADITSRNPKRVRRYLGAFDLVEEKFAEVEEKDHLRNFQPPVDGQEIMDIIGIGEGIAVGIIKSAIREAILEGDIPNEHEAAFALMMRIKDDALRRSALFNEVILPLRGPERRAASALKREIFSGALPEDHTAAMRHLAAIKEEALAGP